MLRALCALALCASVNTDVGHHKWGRPLNHFHPSSSWIKANWFVVAAVLLVATDLAVLQLSDRITPRLREFGLLFDLCVILPTLYLACYWRNGRPSVLRAIAMASLGFWAASKVLPGSGQFLIPQLWPAKYIALAVLALIELKVMLAVYRAVFSGATRQEATALLRREGMPAWVAKLAAAEAALWSALYRGARAIFASFRR